MTTATSVIHSELAKGKGKAVDREKLYKAVTKAGISYEQPKFYALLQVMASQGKIGRGEVKGTYVSHKVLPSAPSVPVAPVKKTVAPAKAAPKAPAPRVSRSKASPAPAPVQEAASPTGLTPRKKRVAKTKGATPEECLAHFTEVLGAPIPRPDADAWTFMLLPDEELRPAEIVAYGTNVIGRAPKSWFTDKVGPNIMVGFL